MGGLQLDNPSGLELMGALIASAGPTRISYGWVVAIAGMFVTMVWGGVYSYGVFIRPLEEEFGWTRADTVSAASVFLATYSLAGIAFGRLFDRYGPRTIVMIGALLVGAGISLSSTVSQIWQIRLYFGLIAGLGAGALYTPPVAAVQSWFTNKGRGLAVAVVTSGIGLGTLLLVPVSSFLVDALGWRHAFIVMGIGLWALLTAAALVMRVEPCSSRKPATTRRAEDMKGMGVKAALRTRFFWLVYAALFLSSISVMTISFHLVSFATDNDMPKATAAFALGLTGATGMVGRLSFGRLSERIGRKRGMVLAYGIQILSMLLLFFALRTWTLYLFALLFGLSSGGWAALHPALVGDYFGTRSLGAITAVATSAWGVAGAISPYFAGYVFDATGNYQIAFIIGAAACVLASVAILSTKLKVRGQGDH